MANYNPAAYQPTAPQPIPQRSNRSSSASLRYDPNLAMGPQQAGQSPQGHPAYGSTPPNHGATPPYADNHYTTRGSYSQPPPPSVPAIPEQAQPRSYPHAHFTPALDDGSHRRSQEDPRRSSHGSHPSRPSHDSRRHSNSTRHRHSEEHRHHHPRHSHDDRYDGEEQEEGQRHRKRKRKDKERRPTIGDTLYSVFGTIKDALGPRDKY
ncbi:hypothetical protein MBLNU230_g6960t1 [Neophaeotheca triangularis]